MCQPEDNTFVQLTINAAISRSWPWTRYQYKLVLLVYIIPCLLYMCLKPPPISTINGLYDADFYKDWLLIMKKIFVGDNLENYLQLKNSQMLKSKKNSGFPTVKSTLKSFEHGSHEVLWDCGFCEVEACLPSN